MIIYNSALQNAKQEGSTCIRDLYLRLVVFTSSSGKIGKRREDTKYVYTQNGKDRGPSVV